MPLTSKYHHRPRHAGHGGPQQRVPLATLQQTLARVVDTELDSLVMELGAVRTMTREIGLLRMLLSRVVEECVERDDDPRVIAKEALPIVAEIGRAIRTNEQVKDGERDTIAEAMKRTLIEHGRRLRI